MMEELGVANHAHIITVAVVRGQIRTVSKSRRVCVCVWGGGGGLGVGSERERSRELFISATSTQVLNTDLYPVQQHLSCLLGMYQLSFAC